MKPLPKKSVEERLKKLEQLIATADLERFKHESISYLNNQAGLLITFDDASLMKMMTVRVWGNGYSNKPFDTILNIYHYFPEGNFNIANQKNITGNLPTCSAGIINDKCVVWIPKIANYTTYVIETVLSTGSIATNNHTVEVCTEKPEIEYEKVLSMISTT